MDVPVRSVRESLREMAGFSFATCALSGYFIYMLRTSLPQRFSESLFDDLAAMGGVLLQHIGWLFGLLVPVLLGLYVLVLGGQWVMGPHDGSRLRRDLSLVAEWLAAGLVPCVALVGIFCLSEPIEAASLLAIIPAMALTVFLASQLGRFLAYEPAEKLKAAERVKAWARQKLGAVRRRAWLPMPVTIGANVAVANIASALVFAGSGGKGPLWAVVAYSTCLQIIYLIGQMTTRRGRYTAVTRFDRATRFVPIVCVLPALALGVLEALIENLPSLAWSVVAGIFFLTVSACWPLRKPGRRSVTNWTIRGCASRSAAIYLTRRYVRSCNEVRDLRGDGG